MTTNGRKVDCRRCRHFRSAPYRARVEGCYYPENMENRQSAAYLDEQQVPGDHTRINARGDCGDFEARSERGSFWNRLFSLSA